ncbi:MAG: SAM-dependent methyltransferase [uncultured bacterium]|uniref:Methyltransferase type 12 n=1 Tax=Candidatus Daviesbacteria bacterium GW2011_GWC2_40_12 TaxID=1618431 RepID=A0A0G0QR88_9BACT|nr:MAG: SAM-dependent methyltransferase [uncultured bacterium]KKQ82581.1 MAG: Methyltransferase type 12 [Candidatus Daviesbacteria bacterium GW2011_GWF2_38_7]KKR17244.1 MAG: Methyltransferase type 12 [Candidatus Daviesbacteria bacterium GW2011_GWA2_39_33]KKR42643.1 MAG: Methyltransferase type 12 [Candidatus Daviesbacteria bacterium GW2011_GWC2_40_12]OGE21318.1 MAG: hypothetical protein A2778_04080 [Candidatus Daviesbacteria bacterium RIFCSPHIGHO2_01_FULL_40_24]OGE30164.1 MAG: hypothetical prot
MNNYVKHLEELSTSTTLKRKKNYVDYNLKKCFRDLGFNGIKVLEVGPGLGEFESYLNDRGVSSIDIVDNDKNILNYVSKKYRINRCYLTKDISLVDKKLGSYDFIFLMQVLEHLPQDKYDVVLRLLYKHLRKDGYLVVVVPNANNPLGLTERYGDLQHTGSFTEQSLRDLVSLSGIENYSMEIRGYEIPPYDFINLFRIIFQKILHLMLLLAMIANGGLFFKTMTPNIALIIKKN